MRPRVAGTLPVTRRGLLAAASAAAIPTRLPDWAGSIAALVGDGLLPSYLTAGEGAFDRTHASTAYTYDNAVAGLALLASGRRAEAQALGLALVAAQGHDRFYQDGRLRNAYRAGRVAAGAIYPLPGWWEQSRNAWSEDLYQVSTATGPVAWAMLLWCALHAATGKPVFRGAAEQAGRFVLAHCRAPLGFYGGFLGWEPKPARLAWVSCEQNVDLCAAFLRLGWAEPAAHARALVAACFDPQRKRFAAGLTPAGRTNMLSAADANLWPGLLPGAPPAWADTLDWVLQAQGLPPGQPRGIDFNEDRDGIWLEGTAYLALAAERAARPALRAACLGTLAEHTSRQGWIYASSVDRLSTGLSTGLQDEADFFYYRRPALAPTAWAVLAQLGANPFTL